MRGKTEQNSFIETQRDNYLEVINSFAEGLMIAGSVRDVVWCITENAISKMGYPDCVVYLLNESSKQIGSSVCPWSQKRKTKEN